MIDDALGLQPLEAAVDVADQGVVAQRDRAESGVDLRLICEDRIVIAPKRPIHALGRTGTACGVTMTPVGSPSSSSADIAVFGAAGEARKLDQVVIGSTAVMRRPAPARRSDWRRPRPKA